MMKVVYAKQISVTVAEVSVKEYLFLKWNCSFVLFPMKQFYFEKFPMIHFHCHFHVELIIVDLNSALAEVLFHDCSETKITKDVRTSFKRFELLKYIENRYY